MTAVIWTWEFCDDPRVGRCGACEGKSPSVLSRVVRKSHMHKEEFVHKMQVALLEERSVLEKGLSQITKHIPDFEADEESNAAAVAEYTDSLALEEELSKALRDVVNALDRIDGGAYGICKYCGISIDEKRLLARPASSSCVDCKKRMTLEA